MAMLILALAAGGYVLPFDQVTQVTGLVRSQVRMAVRPSTASDAVGMPAQLAKYVDAALWKSLPIHRRQVRTAH